MLHRLRILQIPGFVQVRGPSFARHKTDLSEGWTVKRHLETDSALIEAALYGATLLTAAGGRLEERTRDATRLGLLADALVDAVHAGILALTTRWLGEMRALVATEASLTELGHALGRLVGLARGEGLVSGAGAANNELTAVFEACYDRGLWLFEGVTGATAAFDEGHVEAVRALRDAVRHSDRHADRHASGLSPYGPGASGVSPYRPGASGLSPSGPPSGPPSGLSPSGPGASLNRAHGRAVCERRSVDAEAPPALRGAALGFLWSVEADETHDAPVDAVAAESAQSAQSERALLALRGAARPETLGDFLAGLFALARGELLMPDNRLLQAIDETVSGFAEHDFFVALPALRQAFAYFPPRERLAIAEVIVGTGGTGRVGDDRETAGASADPMSLLHAPASPETVMRGREQEARARALGVRYGLLPGGEP